MKVLKWIGSSYEDLISFPEKVRRLMGYALHIAQIGETHVQTRVFKGIGNAKVFEIRENDRSGTYRVVYTVEMQEYVFVLHAFQKKSKTGKETPKQDVDLIHARLKQAWAYYRELKNREEQ